jgi:hypothetical protein
MAGYDGQNSLDGPLAKQGAKRQFETKFKSKTSGSWSDRDSLVRDPKKYYYLKTSYDFSDPASQKDVVSSNTEPKTKPVECKLPERLQHLIRLVCNVDEMAKQMSEVTTASVSFLNLAAKHEPLDSRLVMTPKNCLWVNWQRVLYKTVSDF